MIGSRPLLRLMVFALVALMLVLVVGCGGRVDAQLPGNPPASDAQAPGPVPEQVPEQAPEQVSQQVPEQNLKRVLVLYFGNDNADGVVPESREVTVPPEKTAAQVIIEELVKGPRNPQLHRTIPVETGLLSIEVRNGIAYADFSREIQSQHPGGTAGESMTVFSVVNSLTELPEIKEVQFLLEGKVEYAIWGHGMTDKPIARNENFIKS